VSGRTREQERHARTCTQMKVGAHANKTWHMRDVQRHALHAHAHTCKYLESVFVNFNKASLVSEW